jgi:hypothetical protein
MKPESTPILDAEEVKTEIEKINKLSQMEMASLWRFAPSGHPYFDSSKPYFKIFKERFNKLGGFTPEISKSLEF